MDQRVWVNAKDFQPGMVIPTSTGRLPVTSVQPQDDGRVSITLEGGFSFLSVPLAGAWISANEQV